MSYSSSSSFQLTKTTLQNNTNDKQSFHATTTTRNTASHTSSSNSNDSICKLESETTKLNNEEDIIKISSDYFTNLNLNIDENINNENTTAPKATATTREIDTLTDICSSDNIAEVDVISLLDENIPTYKLRADTIFSHSNCDWIRAPLYFDEQQISELTNEQIKFTLDYFILSGYRVSQMTKTYYDIGAVTKLLDEKERDLELAATIGKQLLEKDQQLEVKIEILEQELERTTEMVNQLRHEITLKDNLLKSFIDSEEDILIENRVEPSSSKKISDINIDILNEYKRKINYLENENYSLRNRADYFETETADFESKENSLIENCFKELEGSQSILRSTQQELQSKTSECINQQEEINNLFSQVFELQFRIKNLTQDNNDLESIYESSKSDLLEQINDLKERYNECLQLLSKSHEEISILRRKSNSNAKRTSTSYTNQQNLIDSSSLTSYDFDETSDLDSSLFKPSSKSSLYSPWMSIQTNTNSLASEVFTSIAKDYRIKNSNLPLQASQSSAFIKKVKQKLTKQLPGSNLESCLQSDSELELMLNSSNDLEQHLQHQLNKSAYFAKLTNCPTPDSILSTGSASLYSNILARSSSFILPEKLQIVKPIEGSQTLQHWQYLATPNLGCLFENRPGISIKGNSSDSDKNSEKKELDFEEDDGVYDENDEFGDYDYEDNDDQEDFLSYFQNINDTLRSSSTTHDSPLITEKPVSKGRVLSPSKMELLAKLLQNEENNQNLNSQETNEDSFDTKNSSIMGFFKNISNKYFKTSENENDLTENTRMKKRQDCDDPDTPPSSPINLPNEGQNLFEFAKVKLVDSLSNYFKAAPTPPGTPTAGLELDDEYESPSSSDESVQDIDSGGSGSRMQNFFDQIVTKLSSFAFKSIPMNKKNNSDILKPSPVYANPVKTDLSKYSELFKSLTLKTDFDENETDAEIQRIEEKSKLCSTPPPSPSKFSPPLPDLDYQAYTEEDMKKSAFIKVTSLNPFINQSVDLASLLGSLSSLKRSQRSCKYNS